MVPKNLHENSLNDLHDKKKWPWFLGLSLFLGALLRLVWGLDIEYKYDEHFMFQQTQTREFWESLLSPGMTSGVFLPNPGLSIALFVALADLFKVASPPELARVVQISNILALCILAWIAWKKIEDKYREAWLWSAALVCVNPIAILLQRKIWAQSMLPLFCALMILAWFRRNRTSGAFFWGLIGAMLGQIHMSGFFFAAAVVGWTAIKKMRVAWVPWFLGSILGALPLIPWASYLLSHPLPEQLPSGWTWLNFVESFWNYWITDSLGLGLSYSLHKKAFIDFLSYPLLGEAPTYLVAVFHLMLAAAGIFIFVKAFQRFLMERPKTPDLILGVEPSQTLQNSGLVGLGAMLHLAGIRVHRHYLIVTFPLEWLWLSSLALRSTQTRRLLPWIWGLQLGLSVLFLYYIHVNGGAPTGDYGVAYSKLTGIAQ